MATVVRELTELVAEGEASVDDAHVLVAGQLGYGNPTAGFGVQCDSCDRLLILNDRSDVVRPFNPDGAKWWSSEGRGSQGLFAESRTDVPLTRPWSPRELIRRGPAGDAVQLWPLPPPPEDGGWHVYAPLQAE